jgi:hypothetical protein
MTITLLSRGLLPRDRLVTATVEALGISHSQMSRCRYPESGQFRMTAAGTLQSVNPKALDTADLSEICGVVVDRRDECRDPVHREGVRQPRPNFQNTGAGLY